MQIDHDPPVALATALGGLAVACDCGCTLAGLQDGRRRHAHRNDELAEVYDLAVDETCVYYVDTGWVMRVSK